MSRTDLLRLYGGLPKKRKRTASSRSSASSGGVNRSSTEKGSARSHALAADSTRVLEHVGDDCAKEAMCNLGIVSRRPIRPLKLRPQQVTRPAVPLKEFD